MNEEGEDEREPACGGMASPIGRGRHHLLVELLGTPLRPDLGAALLFGWLGRPFEVPLAGLAPHLPAGRVWDARSALRALRGLLRGGVSHPGVSPWRRGRDSNSRWRCRHTAFREPHLKPLGHPSGAGFYPGPNPLQRGSGNSGDGDVRGWAFWRARWRATFARLPQLPTLHHFRWPVG